MANTVTIDAKLDEKGVVSGAKKIKVSLEDIKKADGGLDWKGVEAGGEAAEKAGDGFTIFKGIVANLASTAITACVEGLKNVAAAALELGKSALDAYASYEQLTGGVETLFGESADKVKRYAGNAYETAGMSANAYMETVTSFSASLLQSLGKDTDQAADYAHKAIVDMSDNANKMGSNITDIQNAYQGFAKQNYTMLDNLKLGYGGTQEEMKRLIEDANKVKAANGEMADLSIDSFADVVEAIHVVQTEMGITGTTAAEASTTIEGSLNSAKAAWENWLVSLGTGDETMIAENTVALVDAAVTAASNIIPRVMTILGSLGEVISTHLADMCQWAYSELMDRLPETVREPVQGAIDTVMELTDNLSSMLPVLAAVGGALLAYKAYSVGVTVAEKARAAATLLTEKATALLNGTMKLNPIGIVITLIGALVAAFMYLWNTSEEFRNFWIGVWDAVCAAVQPIAEWVMANVITPMIGYFQEFQAQFSAIWDAVIGYLTMAWENIAPIVQAGMQVVQNIIAAIMPVIEAVWDNAWGVISAVATAVWNAISNTVSTVMGVIQGIIQVVTGIISGDWDAVWNGIRQIFESIINGILQAGANVFNALTSIISAVLTGIYNVWASIWNGVFSVASSIWNAITTAISSAVSGIWNNITSTFNSLVGTVMGIFNGVKNAITNPIETAKNTVKGIIDTIAGFFNNFHISLPHINLPHFSISPPGWQIGDLLKGSIPSLGIEWYATGGMFNGPSIIGVGEAGTEFVVPRDGKNMRPFAQAVSENLNFPSPEEFAAAIVGALMAAGFGKTVLNIDGKTLGEALAPYLDQINGNRYTSARRGLAL